MMEGVRNRRRAKMQAGYMTLPIKTEEKSIVSDHKELCNDMSNSLDQSDTNIVMVATLEETPVKLKPEIDESGQDYKDTVNLMQNEIDSIVMMEGVRNRRRAKIQVDYMTSPIKTEETSVVSDHKELCNDMSNSLDPSDTNIVMVATLEETPVKLKPEIDESGQDYKDTVNSMQNEIDSIVNDGVDTEMLLEIKSKASDNEEDAECRIEGDIDVQYDYQCPKCEMVFDDSHKLVTHLPDCYQTSSVTPPVKSSRGRKPHSEGTVCTQCGKTFLFPSHLVTHMRSHMDVRPFVCDICGSSYRYFHLLKVHKRKHTGEKPFVCDLCDKAFADKPSLKLHKKSHSSLVEFICDTCGRGFNTVNSLKTHYLSHTVERPYQCNICGLSFKSKGTCTVHIRRHEKRERNLECSVCQRMFADISVLKQHTETHFKEKRFTCETCGKKFLRLYNLNVHQRIHTGHKPYACPACQRCFTQRAGLKSHMKSHPSSCLAVANPTNVNPANVNPTNVNPTNVNPMTVDRCVDDKSGIFVNDPSTW